MTAEAGRRFDWRRIRLRALSVVVLAVAAFGALQGYDALTIDSEAMRLASLLGLKRGFVVGEVGAGKGKMTVRMARHVGPGGHVFSTEIDGDRLAGIRRAASKAGLQNVTVIEGGERDARLPEGCCDAIFMRKVYHHFTDPAAMNASLQRALRRGGRLAIIDFPPSAAFWLWRPSGVPENRGGHGIRRSLLIEEMTQAGFRVERTVEDWYAFQYCVVFRKPS